MHQVAKVLKHLSLVFSSVTQSCLTLCDPVDCRTSGFPVLHYLQELAQTHVHRLGDAIQPSHPLSPLLLLPSVFPSIRVFSNELALHITWPNYWSFSFSISPSNEYSGLISLRIDWFDLPESKGLSRVFSSTTVQKHQTAQKQIVLIFCFLKQNTGIQEWHGWQVLALRFCPEESPSKVAYSCDWLASWCLFWVGEEEMRRGGLSLLPRGSL